MTAPSGPIVFNSSTGSDTLGSGLGPATAVNSTTESTTASYSGTTITFSGATDLSGVADGDMLFLATSSGRKFFVIASVNDGADSLTVDDTPTGTSSGLSWAIGGKRASLAGSSQLYSSGGDIKAGWILEMESGYTETFSARFDFYGLGTTTDGPVTLRGADGAATRPVITLSSTADFVPRNNYQLFRNFDLVRTSGSVAGIVATVAGNQVFDGLKLDGFTVGIQFSGVGRQTVKRCQILNCGAGITSAIQNNKILQNRFSNITGDAVDASGVLSGLEIVGNIFDTIGGIGCDINQTRTDAFGAVAIAGNIFYDCAVDSIEYSGDHDSLGGLRIQGNVFSNSGAYALEMSGISANSANARGVDIIDNAFYLSTTGHRNIDIGSNNIDLTADPFVDAAAGDFNINNDAGGGATLRAETLTL